MNTPNLFNFATSELSQDAFIAWLLSWAKQEYKTGSDKHKALNKIAIDVLTLFFQKAGKQLPSYIENIDVKRQVNHIDVLCIINETYAVLIEDKVGTVQHSNQLIRYKNYLVTGHHKKFDEEKIVPIYLQTHDQSNYNQAIVDGFYPVTRKDLLKVFNSANDNVAKQSDIYADYYEYISAIETAVQSFKTEPVQKWNRQAWIGFFQYLQTQLGEGTWKFVPNPAGGFMGFWGFGRKVDDISVYLQLQQDKVCFKVNVPKKEERKKTRSIFYKIFTSEADKFGLIVRKPARFGNGRSMTFAVLETDVFSDAYHSVKLEAIVELLSELRTFISHCVDLYEQPKAKS